MSPRLNYLASFLFGALIGFIVGWQLYGQVYP